MTGSILSGCVLLGMGSNPAAVRVFRNRPPKDLRQSDRRCPMQGHLPCKDLRLSSQICPRKDLRLYSHIVSNEGF